MKVLSLINPSADSHLQNYFMFPFYFVPNICTSLILFKTVLIICQFIRQIFSKHSVPAIYTLSLCFEIVQSVNVYATRGRDHTVHDTLEKPLKGHIS